VAVHRFDSFDGTDLAYYTAGRRDGPVMMLCNGLGGSMVVWQPLIRRFASRFRLISWDYRGLYASRPAPDPGAYGIPAHVRDLLALMEREQVEAPVLVGWSMGVQVILELHRSHPDVARALVALHGTAGYPLRTAFDASIAELVSPAIFGAMNLLGRNLAGIGPRLARNANVIDGFMRGVSQLGWMGRGIDPGAFGQLAEEWTSMDLATYAEIFRQLNEHDASDLLASIRTPTLAIAGGRDRFTPPHLSARLAAEMPDAVLHIVDEATHFGPLEHPDAIGECIEDYLQERAGSAFG
jgi:pimeloyl-ACP methyl ester carboxylesterase